jgi:hypothetical protein
MSAFAPCGLADFVPPFAISSFTLTNSTNADGSADSPDGGATLVLTGPNDGSGLPGYTEFTIVSPITGLFRFSYVYHSLDAPGRDSAGYVLNGAVHTLATADGQSGQVSIPVKTGDRIGFRIDTTDNIAEPGVLTISSFSPPAAAVPTISGVGMVLLAALLAGSGLVSMRLSGGSSAKGAGSC